MGNASLLKRQWRSRVLLFSVAIVTGVSCMGVANATPVAPASRAARPAVAGNLAAVSCISADDCWAAGYRNVTSSHKGAAPSSLNETLRWNGTRWRNVYIPSPDRSSSGDDNTLYDVRCRSASDCWAVGAYGVRGSNALLSDALHWTGRKWTLVSTPSPGGTANNAYSYLSDVACLTARSCWAVGGYGVGIQVNINMILHWNGKKWSEVSVPNPAGTRNGDLNGLTGVSCLTAANCWADGEYGKAAGTFIQRNEMLHWNGRKWSTAQVPNPDGTKPGTYDGLDQLACTSARNCWAVGSYGVYGSYQLNQALHWNGRRWSTVKVPEPDGTGTGAANLLLAVGCAAAYNCWAVGDYGAASSPTGTLNQVLHWTGARWVVASVPDPGGSRTADFNSLNGVSCASGKACWSVGVFAASGASDNQEILRWNNKTWLDNFTIK